MKRTIRTGAATIVAMAFVAGLTFAGDLDFSDPAKLPPAVPGAAGYPSRDANFDALPGFVKPPAGYGEVGFFWWLGDPLTKERLTWQMDQLKDKGVMGLQINYAHSDRGGHSYGLTYPSDPPLFSPAWWDLVCWFLQEAKSRGMAISLSDYTLGFGQGWYIDEIIKENPEVNGAVLHSTSKSLDGDREFTWELPANTIGVTAYRIKGREIEPGSGVDLRPNISGGTLKWKAPAGKWQAVAVMYAVNPVSIDPMHPLSGKKTNEKFFQRFEDRNPGEGGKGLNFFFSDELTFGVSGNMWNRYVADEFRKRKGYDLVPELPALFTDIGPRTPKVRLDYRDVIMSLSEENYFKPVFDWHWKRGMIYGCDHGGRGRNVVEFGDYYRAMRWNQGPGNDQPRLATDIIKTKVNSSIAHLYERQRCWLEGFYSSGWGTTPAQVAEATFRNFAHGQNLLTLHGLYYSTHGGYWEWAPPCNHFHMPYWPHMGEFLRCAERLSYLMSQGVHRCDVAIVYPVAPMEAAMDGQVAVKTAFELGADLYKDGIDFDFIDFESVVRAKIQDRQLQVSGESYRVLVLPAMKAVRHNMLVKAAEFAKAGGIVLAAGALPEASDRVGRNDPEVEALVKAAFPRTVSGAKEIEAILGNAFLRDYEGPGDILHRQVGPRDVYMIYGAPKGTACTFRASGKVELWDPWTGQPQPLAAISQKPGQTVLRMPLTEKEVQLIVFSPGQAEIGDADSNKPPSIIPIEGEWEFELKPTLDNRWGDYHWPPTPTMIGAEARRMHYAAETAGIANWQDPKLDDSKWPMTTVGFGPKFWRLGPMSANVSLDKELAGLKEIDPAKPVQVGGRQYKWQPYEFSWRWGIEDNPGHQGYHGLKENISDDFLILGVPGGKAKRNWTSYVASPAGTRYYFWTSVPAAQPVEARPLAGDPAPSAIWVNSSRFDTLPATVPLQKGANSLLLRYDKPGRTHFVLDTGKGPVGHSPEADEQPARPVAETDAKSAESTANAGESPFSAAAMWVWYPNDRTKAQRCFRKTFTVGQLPAKAPLRITCDNAYKVYVNGKAAGSGDQWERVQEYDVAKLLQAGANVLAVDAYNGGADGGVIAELVMGENRVATDKDWLCAPAPVQGWLEAGFNDSAWRKVEVLSTFAQSLWVNHPQGPPRLDSASGPPAGKKSLAAVAQGQPVFKLSPLSMIWNERPGVLPFDIQPQVARPAGWYRFTSPPGLRAMTITAKGTPVAWADGRPMKVEPGKKPNQFVATVDKPAAGCVPVAIRVEQERGCYGGEAIPAPIELSCTAGTIALGDWSQIDGLAAYSGGAWYRKTVNLAPAQIGRKTVLNLGNVDASAEVRVNGQLAGIRLAPPWTVDISKLVKAGDNRIEVLVYNTLANHYLTIPTSYRGSPLSGLLGPVTVETEK